MARGRNRILVPEARAELDALKAKVGHSQSPQNAKYEVAKELNIPLREGYNGELTPKQAGKVGGRLGGNMVKELVKMAKKNLSK